MAWETLHTPSGDAFGLSSAANFSYCPTYGSSVGGRQARFSDVAGAISMAHLKDTTTGHARRMNFDIAAYPTRFLHATNFY